MPYNNFAVHFSFKKHWCSDRQILAAMMLNITELTDEQEAVVNRSLKGGPADQVLVEAFRLQICRRDIATLFGLNWLNDEVSNICLLFYI